jgi:hypothetical protein
MVKPLRRMACGKNCIRARPAFLDGYPRRVRETRLSLLAGTPIPGDNGTATART